MKQLTQQENRFIDALNEEIEKMLEEGIDKEDIEEFLVDFVKESIRIAPV